MTGARLRVVRRADGYRGMDRPSPLPGEIPDDLLTRIHALEDTDPERAAAGLAAAVEALRAGGDDRWELIAIGNDGGGWEPLGLDVGEATPRAWSAIRHRADFLPVPDAEQWSRRLNDHGLFDARGDADAFLAAYLAADDPDRGWTPEGWDDDGPGIYAVLPVHRAPAR